MKYIDADKLIAEIERLQKRAKHYEEVSLTDGERSYWSGEDGALRLLTTFITSLQQEQPSRKSHKVSWIEETKKELQHEEELLDMRLEALKRIREKKNQFKQEQPEADLDEEVESYLDGFIKTPTRTYFRNAIRHFYELGLNAGKEE